MSCTEGPRARAAIIRGEDTTLSARGESAWKISIGTAIALIGSLLGGGAWLGAMQTQVTSLKAELSQTQAAHGAMMTKLEQIDARIVELQVELTRERAQQQMLHRGQLPVTE